MEPDGTAPLVSISKSDGASGWNREVDSGSERGNINLLGVSCEGSTLDARCLCSNKTGGFNRRGLLLLVAPVEGWAPL